MEVTNITNKQLRDDGFVLLKGVVDLERIRRLYECAVHLLQKFNPKVTADTTRELLSLSPFDNQPFNEILLKFRAEEPKLFGVLYDTIQLSISIQQLSNDEKLAKAITEAWGLDDRGVALTGHMLRMDRPQDTRNVLNWHQDSSYYEQNQHGANGLVIWVPMHHVDSSNGAVIVLPKSQKVGRLSIAGTSGDTLVSQQFTVPSEIVNKFEPFQIKAEAGDALIFGMDLVHRSGTNSSQSFRFVAGFRYHSMLAEDFLPGKLIYQNNTSVGRLSDYFKQNGRNARV
jgi:hypothetical protein